MTNNSFLILIIIIGLIIIGHAEDNTDACPKIITKKKWGARAAKNITYQIFPLKYVIINHTVTPRCTTRLQCANTLLGIQNFYMNELDGDDIPFNFLISDKDIYEGTGWHIRGAHTYGYNSNGTGIAFIGNFSEELPTSEAMDLAKRLLECGVLLGELEENYRLLGARQVIATESPGLELYGELQDWDHWSPNP